MKHVVEVKTVFELDGSTDDMLISCPAEYEYADGRQTIRYDEYNEAGGCIATRVEIDACGVDIIRSGEGAISLKLRVGERISGMMTLEFGRIVLEYLTERIDNRLGEEGGTLTMRYTMDIGGVRSLNTVELTVKKIK